MYAAVVGIQNARGRLGHATPGFRSESRKTTPTNAGPPRFPQVAAGNFSREQQLDRLALRSSLLLECEGILSAGGTDSIRNALDAVLNILLFELQRGEDEPQAVAANLRSLLRETPRYLAEGCCLAG